METRHLGVDDFEFDQIAEFDESILKAIDTGESTVALVTSTGVHVTVGSTCIQADLDDEIDSYRDVAVGEDVVALCDETVYRLEGGVAVHQHTVPGAEAILAGPNSRFVSVICGDGTLVWLDPKKKLTQVGESKNVPVVNPKISTTGNGWTVLTDGDELYLYREPHNQQSLSLTVTLPSVISNASVTDLSYVDDTIVIATNEGLVRLEISGETVSQSWKDLDTVVQTLSPPARGAVYGWDDDAVYRIIKSGPIERLDGIPYSTIHTTTSHDLYILGQENTSRIVTRDLNVTTELFIDSISYQQSVPVELGIQNESSDVLNYILDIETEGLRFEPLDEGPPTIEIPPISQSVYEIGRVFADERAETGELRIREDSSGEMLAQTEVSIEYGTPDIDVETQPDTPDQNERTVAPKIINSGDGVMYVAPHRENLIQEGKEILPGESDRIAVEPTSEGESIYFVGADPTDELEHVQIDVSDEKTDNPCTSNSRVSPVGNTIHTTLQNHTKTEITERVDIEIDGQPSLSGKVSLSPNSEVEIWHPVSADSSGLLEVRIEGEDVIGPYVDQVWVDSPIGVERQFYTTDGEAVSPKEVPPGQQFKERLILENQSDKRLTNITISGKDGWDVDIIAPGSELILSRNLAIPESNQHVPSVTVSNDESVTLPQIGVERNSDDLSFVARAEVRESTLDLAVRIIRPARKENTIQLEKLSANGNQLPLDGINRNIEPGGSLERSISCDLSPGWLVKNGDETITVEASFSETTQQKEFVRTTLAPVSTDSSGPRLNPTIERSTNKIIGNDTYKLRLNPESGRGTKSLIVLRNPSKQLERKNVRITSNTEIKFHDSNRHRQIEVRVRGTEKESFDCTYTFRRHQNRGWILSQSSDNVEFPSEPIVTSWNRSG